MVRRNQKLHKIKFSIFVVVLSFLFASDPIYYQFTETSNFQPIIIVDLLQANESIPNGSGEIGVFDGELCCGAIVYEHESRYMVLNAWESYLQDNPNGFVQGNPIIFKYYDYETQEELYLHDIVFSQYPGWDASGLFNVGSICGATITINSPPEFVSSPNDRAYLGIDYIYNIVVNELDNDAVTLTTFEPVPSWLTFTDNGNGTATIAGNPGLEDLGTEFIEIIASDPFDAESTQPYILYITADPNDFPPEITGIPDLFVDEGSNFPIFDLDDYVIVSDGDEVVWEFEGNQELIVSMNEFNLVSIEPPHENWNGSETVTFTVTDANTIVHFWDYGEATFTVNPVNDAPVLTTIGQQYADEDEVFILPLYAEDIDSENLTFDASTYNEEVTIFVDDNQVMFSFTENYFGTAWVTVSVTDGEFLDSETFILTILPVNDAPNIDLPEQVSFNEGEQLIVDFTGYLSDIDGDALSLSVSGNEYVVIDIYGLMVIMNSSENWNGTETITFIADDGVGGTATSEVDVIVYPVNSIPELNIPSNFTFNEDEITTIDFQPFIYDADGNYVSLSVSNNDMIDVEFYGYTVVLIPQQDWNGSDVITFTGDDGYGGVVSTDVEIIVLPVNDAPTITLPVNFTFNENSELIVNFTDYVEDIDGDAMDLSHSGNDYIDISTYGMMVILSTTADWNGSEFVTFIADDSFGGIAFDEIEIIVNPVNSIPELSLPNNFSLVEDVATVIDFEQFVFDADGDILELSVSENIVLDIEIDGYDVTILPQENWNGIENVTFIVDDGYGGVAFSDIEIIVSPINDSPAIFLPENFTFNEGSELIVDFGEFTEDIDGDVLTLSSSNNENIEINIYGLMVIFSSFGDWNGSEVVTFYLSDEQGRAISSDDVEIIVSPLNSEPEISLPISLSFNEDEELILSIADYFQDNDGDELNITVSESIDLNVEVSLEIITITSPDNWSGSEILTFTVEDGFGGMVTADVEIFVVPVNDSPIAENRTIQLLEEEFISFYLLAEDVDNDLSELTYQIVDTPDNAVVFQSIANQVTYKPIEDFNGTDYITFTVSDLDGDVSNLATVTLDVMPINDPPIAQSLVANSGGEAIFQIDLADVIEDAETSDNDLTINFVLTHPNGDGKGAFGGRMTNIGGAIWQYDQNGHSSNIDYIPYRVIDEAGVQSGTKVITITNLPGRSVSTRFIIADNSIYDVDENSSIEVEFLGIDFATFMPLNITLNNSPQFGEFSNWSDISFDGGVTTQTAMYTAGNLNATEVISYTVSNFSGSADGSVTINIEASNCPPQIYPIQNVVFEEGEMNSVLIGYSDEDSSPQNLSWSTESIPELHGLSLGFTDISEESITLTIDLPDYYYGSSVIIVSVEDETGLSSSQDLMLEVTPVNDSPILTLPDEFTFDEDTEFVSYFSGFMSDPDDDALTLTVEPTTNLNVSVGDDYIVTFNSAENWNGTETVTFTVNDEQGRAISSDVVEVVVNPVNDLPTIDLPDSLTFEEDNVLVEDFGAYLNDIDGDVVTLSASGYTNIGVAIVGQTVTFTPTVDWYGSEVLTFFAGDGIDAEIYDAIEIVVTPVNDSPILTLPDEFTFDEDTEFVSYFSGFMSDPDDDALTLTVEPTTNLVVNVGDGYIVTFNSSENWNGTETVSFSVNDEQGATGISSIVVNVEPIDDAPEIMEIQDQNIEFGGVFDPIDLNSYLVEVDGDVVAWSVLDYDELIIDVNDGILTIDIPAEWWMGFESITIIALDQTTNMLSDIATIILSVSYKIDYEFSWGWSWKSFPVLPFVGNTFAEVFAPIVEDIVMIRGQNDYWIPNLNNSITIDNQKCYMVKMDEEVFLPEFSGARIDPLEPLSFGEGWNWIGYYATNDQWAELAFSSMMVPNFENLIFVKSYGGLMTNSPVGWINGIGELHVGEGYLVKVDHAEDFVWPEGTQISKASNLNMIYDNPSATTNYFTFEKKQDYDVVIFSLTNTENNKIEVGSEFAVFDNGNCIGATVYSGLPAQQIQVWETTDDYEFRFWNKNVEIVVPNVEHIEFEGWDESITGVEINAELLKSKHIPTEFGLSQNYPNPFNPTTNISYQLPDPCSVLITVYTIQGQLVTTLVNSDLEAGYHSVVWNGTNFNGESVSSGVYFYSIQSDNFKFVKKMLLMK